MPQKLQVDRWLFSATAGLALFGVVMVYSASAVIAQRENGNQYYYVIKQGIWTSIGFVVMLAAIQFDYNRLRDRRIVYGLLLLTVLLLLAVFFSGLTLNLRSSRLQMHSSIDRKILYLAHIARTCVLSAVAASFLTELCVV